MSFLGCPEGFRVFRRSRRNPSLEQQVPAKEPRDIVSFGCCMRNLLITSGIAILIVVTPRTEPTPLDLVVSFPSNEVGTASVYSEDLDGNPTANGEIYDMNGLTAAHRTLPLGTKVRVTNLRNKRSLVLRINDRGPFIPGRILDVSMAAARRLGFGVAGLALVRVRVLSYPKGYHPSDVSHTHSSSGG